MRVFKKKAPITFEYEDVTFELPGEMPVATMLALYEMQQLKGTQAEVSVDDVRGIYETLLGAKNAHKLIDELGAGQATLEEIIEWYGQVLADRSKTDPKVKKAAGK